MTEDVQDCFPEPTERREGTSSLPAGGAVPSAKHTPGPWVVPGERPRFVSANLDPSGEEREHVNRSGSLNSGCWIAEAKGPDALANARLIAAAPDLLEALKGLLNHTGVAEAAPEDKDGEDHIAEGRALAAILKATGAGQ